MLLSEVRPGMVVTVGHPANKRFALKSSQDGAFHYVENGALVDMEDFRGGWDIVEPGSDAMGEVLDLTEKRLNQIIDALEKPSVEATPICRPTGRLLPMLVPHQVAAADEVLRQLLSDAFTKGRNASPADADPYSSHVHPL